MEKQKFPSEQKDSDLINLTDVYLFHCLVFCNLSQNTSISSSYHQHLGRWVNEDEGQKEEEEEKEEEENKEEEEGEGEGERGGGGGGAGGGKGEGEGEGGGGGGAMTIITTVTAPM